MGGDADWRREKMRSWGDGWTKLSPGSVGGWGGGESKGVYYFRTSFCGGHQIHQLLEGQRVNAESPSLVTAFTD